MTSTELYTFLQTRHSIRRFKPDPVPNSVLNEILHTATFAPSAHNLQPWRFVVVTSSTKARLGEALTNTMRIDMQTKGASATEISTRVGQSLRRLGEAPVVILLCRDATAVRTNTPEETIMGIQSNAAAGLQLLLAAHAAGLGGNWICWPLYAQAETREVLKLPSAWEPQAMFFIGYPAKEVKSKKRQPFEEITKWI